MTIKEIIKQPEGRRLEFKEILPENPQIEFRWKEVGLSFQVQFVKLDYIKEQELEQELQQELHIGVQPWLNAILKY